LRLPALATQRNALKLLRDFSADSQEIAERRKNIMQLSFLITAAQKRIGTFAGNDIHGHAKTSKQGTASFGALQVMATLVDIDAKGDRRFRTKFYCNGFPVERKHAEAFLAVNG
jgi:hypothetical protein